MSIDKPEIPSVELPETWGGTQTPYNESQIANGYEEAVPQIVDGGNVNYEKRGLFENVKYLRTVADSIVNMPIGKVLTVDDNNKLAYETQIRDDTVVHIDGDETITGQKTFKKSIKCNGNFLNYTNIPYTSTPTETTYSGLAVKDSNDTSWASFDGVQYSSGTNRSQITVRGNSGNLRTMYVQETADGTVTYSYGQKMGSNFIAIPRGAGNYVQYCWGSGSKASGNTFTFPSPFNNPPVVVAVIGPEDGGSTINVIVSSVTKTGFKVVHNAPAGDLNKNVSYIAIGTADM